jgi:hypothetical protein
VGKQLGAIVPPIGERAIAFTGMVPRRFQAIGDTTEHDGFGYHGLSHAWFSFHKIDKRSRYSRHGESWYVTSDNFFITS